MAKDGKLTKMLKKVQSIGRQNRSTNSNPSVPMATTSSVSVIPVFVGKSRRRYMVSPVIVDHPLFQELIERSYDDGSEAIIVSCEVVLFEHLLWMLENADPQPDSLDELVGYYACS